MASLNLSQIEEQLHSKFMGEGRQIVFWYDDNAEFMDDVDKLQLPDVKIYHLGEKSQFRTKLLLECEDKDSNYLIYAPFPKPAVQKNHLEDILLYSKRFFADRISLICSDLGIDEAFKPVLARYSKYFAAKERMERFRNLHVAKYDEDSIELALICCICKVRVLSFEEALAKVLQGDLEDNVCLGELAKYQLLKPFWQLCEYNFGYNAIDKSLEKMLTGFFVTCMAKGLKGKIPAEWEHFVLNTHENNIIAFMSGMMNNSQYAVRYDELAGIIAEKLQVQTVLDSCGAEAVLYVDYCSEVDKIIIKWLFDRLLLEDVTATLQGESIQSVCNLRRKMHFGSYTQNYYDLCYSAYELIKAVHYQAEAGFTNITEKYLEHDYKIDYWYRKFYLAFDTFAAKPILSKMQQLVENIYSNIYLNKLLPAWNAEIKEAVEGKFAPMQMDFYERYVRHDRERIVVLISDALRYEVAMQLQERLQQEERCKSIKMQYQLSVLPSYTALGMAALLPHKVITLDEACKVLVDGKKCASLDEREKILQTANINSICLQFDRLKEMKRDELRAAFANKQVIYIYHNQIDARGDAAKTENEVFTAAEEAVEEIYNMLCRLPVSASIVKFIVTADHGFIYQRHAIEENEKLNCGSGNLVTNHRFVIGKETVADASTAAISLGIILGNEDRRYVSYPLGAQIFKTKGGGINYVHGGSSPQEMLVPVLSVKMDRGHVETHLAKLELHTQINKITNRDTNLVFLQTEPISEVVKAARYKLFFADEVGKVISNEVVLTVDSSNADINKRMATVQFTFVNSDYDSHAIYYLVQQELSSGTEVARKEFIVDLPGMSLF